MSGDGNGVVGVEADLERLCAQLTALRELADDLASDSARRYDFSIRWGTMVHGRLHRLAYYRGRGELTAHQQARYDELAAELVAVLPLVERLGLANPGAVDERIVTPR